uniref:Secreted protein n=1 Tax=Zea mays TaxID=4577 RepID=A0A804N3L5_MAIZE
MLSSFFILIFASTSRGARPCTATGHRRPYELSVVAHVHLHMMDGVGGNVPTCYSFGVEDVSNLVPRREIHRNRVMKKDSCNVCQVFDGLLDLGFIVIRV